MRTVNEMAMLGTLTGSGFAAFFLLIGVAVAAKRGLDVGRLAFPGLFALSGVAVTAASLLRLPGWARRRLSQMEEIGARLLARGQDKPDGPAD